MAPFIYSTKAPKDTRVVVAMSGGVDSSVTAALLKEQGYDVIGMTLQLYDHGAAIDKKGACCAGVDIYDAARVADSLGIPHYVLDYESRFKDSVIDEFADSYLHGETPIPCVRCNQKVKFRDMLETARDLGADALATGHYVRRLDGPQGPELHRGTDPTRDQSYFLFTTTREQLSLLAFPLGDMPKTETRALAERFGLVVAQKPDSQDICFVPNGNYADVVEKLRPGAVKPGLIVHIDGRIMGQHAGIIHYTIGQRKGLGLSGRTGDDAEPLFVVRLDPVRNRVLVGPKSALGVAEMTLREVNWLADDSQTILNVMVKTRSAQTPVPAVVTRLSTETAHVHLESPQFGIAPGQACVFYQEDRVLGGGWIQRPEE